MKKRIMKKKIKQKMEFGKYKAVSTTNVYNNTYLTFLSNNGRKHLGINKKNICLVEIGTVIPAGMYDDYLWKNVWGFSMKEYYHELFGGGKIEYDKHKLIEIEFSFEYDEYHEKIIDTYISEIITNGICEKTYLEKMNPTFYKRYLKTGEK